MLGIESIPESAEAATTIGVVLVEALVLYVGYGALTSALAPTIANAIQR